MKLAQAAARFNHTPFAGWDGTQWVPDVAYGRLQVYDRFIADRSFGQKKRILTCGGDSEVPPEYEVLKAPDGAVFLLISMNADLQGTEVYNRTYMLQRAEFSADIVRYATTAKASGAPGAKQEVIDATVFCDMERYASLDSRVVDTVKYSDMLVIVPGSTPVTTDHVLVVDGTYFDVREVNKHMLAKELRAVKRGIT